MLHVASQSRLAQLVKHIGGCLTSRTTPWGGPAITYVGVLLSPHRGRAATSGMPDARCGAPLAPSAGHGRLTVGWRTR